MKIHWAPEAIENLNQIYDFYFDKNPATAALLFNQIIDETDVLLTFPLGAPKEPLLINEPENYRALVIHEHFKVIYVVERELIYIVSIWDCRQDPERLLSYIRTL